MLTKVFDLPLFVIGSLFLFFFPQIHSSSLSSTLQKRVIVATTLSTKSNDGEWHLSCTNQDNKKETCVDYRLLGQFNQLPNSSSISPLSCYVTWNQNGREKTHDLTGNKPIERAQDNPKATNPYQTDGPAKLISYVFENPTKDVKLMFKEQNSNNTWIYDLFSQQ
ncbi:24_t:CDS:1 [Ambispora leptoticha]|uniref:24_t:CDS:1 n=1 Tax=Ambispora leptoticha TaxID=144679 RepID=A0A9N9BEV9_9GLOM|nr:24_t:CDS:1 [Ambispora leptoticha]